MVSARGARARGRVDELLGHLLVRRVGRVEAAHALHAKAVGQRKRAGVSETQWIVQHTTCMRMGGGHPRRKQRRRSLSAAGNSTTCRTTCNVRLSHNMQRTPVAPHPPVSNLSCDSTPVTHRAGLARRPYGHSPATAPASHTSPARAARACSSSTTPTHTRRTISPRASARPTPPASAAGGRVSASSVACLFVWPWARCASAYHRPRDDRVARGRVDALLEVRAVADVRARQRAMVPLRPPHAGPTPTPDGTRKHTRSTQARPCRRVQG